MLSSVEAAFVRLLRGTVVTTAFISIAITIIALIYAAYAQFKPDPKPQLSQRVHEFRNATDPARLIESIFPPNSDLVKGLRGRSSIPPYIFHSASVEEIFSEFNKFLDAFLGGKFESAKQFSDWLFSSNGIELSWSKAISDNNALNEDNVNRLWPSMLFDYAVRLQKIAPILADARNAHKYPTSFDKLTAPTGRAQAPYFLAWYFSEMQTALSQEATRFIRETAEREHLRQQAPIALYVAASAFGYFIFIMFLFLFVSIEASLRKGAEHAFSTKTPSSPPDLPHADTGATAQA